MPLESWIKDWVVAQILYDWQTVIAGVLALAAAWWTVRTTKLTAQDQITAAGEQTKAAVEQTTTTIRVDRERVASENRAFCVMLEAAMARVLAEVAWARSNYAGLTAHASGDPSRGAYVVRTCITKGAFTELRAACVRLGSPLTGEFLDLEREIDSFASQCEEANPQSTGLPATIRVRQARRFERTAYSDRRQGDRVASEGRNGRPNPVNP